MTIAELYWIAAGTKGKLAVAPRPRAGDWLEDEILSWRNFGVQAVVCLLEDHEIAELGLFKEQTYCQAHELEFLRFPIPDRGLPFETEARALSEKLFRLLNEGRNVLIHCRAGIGRTGLVASAVLIQGGFTSTDAMRTVSEARGLQIPDTKEQRDWILSFKRE